jgi:pimeloyl-ACP methyl ester carboxylesterase
MAQYLGDQWSVGDWAGFQRASTTEGAGAGAGPQAGSDPPQNMKEYDPEWARSFYEGAATRNCDHRQMLRRVKVPVLFTHHRRAVDPNTGMLSGALSDFQAQKVKELVASAGQTCDYVSLPDAAHAMHSADPPRFVSVLRPWAMKLSA